MILEIDIGNSRIKWRLLNTAGNTVNSSGSAANIVELDASIDARVPIERAKIACVKTTPSLTEFSTWVGQRWGLRAEVAVVVRCCGGLTVAYEDLSKLGVDRWLAMLAAYKDAQSCCAVVDCGTALTLDIIAESGQHRGGYIVPGLQLFAKSLTEHTGIRLARSDPGYTLGLGNSTEEAVYNGSMAALTALIEKVLSNEFGDLKLPVSQVVYLTGGDAKKILGALSMPGVKTKLVPSLVFDGLAIALP